MVQIGPSWSSRTPIPPIYFQHLQKARALRIERRISNHHCGTTVVGGCGYGLREARERAFGGWTLRAAGEKKVAAEATPAAFRIS